MIRLVLNLVWCSKICFQIEAVSFTEQMMHGRKKENGRFTFTCTKKKHKTPGKLHITYKNSDKNKSCLSVHELKRNRITSPIALANWCQSPFQIISFHLNQLGNSKIGVLNQFCSSLIFSLQNPKKTPFSFGKLQKSSFVPYFTIGLLFELP